MHKQNRDTARIVWLSHAETRISYVGIAKESPECDRRFPDTTVALYDWRREIGRQWIFGLSNASMRHIGRIEIGDAHDPTGLCLGSGAQLQYGSNRFAVTTQRRETFVPLIRRHTPLGRERC